MFNYCPPVKLPDLESKTFEDGKRYYVTPEGNRLPSVTTVLGALKKQEIMAWRKRQCYFTQGFWPRHQCSYSL